MNKSGMRKRSKTKRDEQSDNVLTQTLSLPSCPLAADTFFAIAQFLDGADLVAFATSSKTIWKATIGVVEPFFQLNGLDQATLNWPDQLALWKLTLNHVLACYPRNLESLTLNLKSKCIPTDNVALDDLFLRLFQKTGHVM